MSGLRGDRATVAATRAGTVSAIFLSIALLSACATSGSSMCADAEAISRFDASEITVDGVTVTVDYVPQKDLASQISDFARSSLGVIARPSLSGGSRVAVATIEVNQRSFLSGIDPVNSIFVSLTVTDDNGTPLARSTLYRVGRDSVLSAAVQRDLIRGVAAPLRGMFARKRAGREGDAP